jgi:hypothetical protein
MRTLRLHRLPWPGEQLRDLFGAKVRLRVTLSYFVAPNPSPRSAAGGRTTTAATESACPFVRTARIATH